MTRTGVEGLSAHELSALTGALVAALEAGVFARLVTGAVDERELCRACQCDALAFERVLAVLIAAGVVRREAGKLSLSAALLRDGARAPGGIPSVIQHFGHVPTFLRSGARLAAMDGARAEREQAYAGDVVSGLALLFGAAAALLAQRLAPARHVLDVGAGSGVWSLAMLARAPEAHATAHDLPAVLPAFEQRAAALGLLPRVSSLPGDYHESVLPEGAFDRALLANVLHLESEQGAAALLKHVAGALAPGGQLIVVDVFAIGERGALAHATYELHLAMRTGQGRAHKRERIEGWLRGAGLVPTELIDLGSELQGLGALVARKPGQ